MVAPEIESEYFLFREGANEYHPLYRSDVRACLNQDCELHHPAISRTEFSTIIEPTGEQTLPWRLLIIIKKVIPKWPYKL